MLFCDLVFKADKFIFSKYEFYAYTVYLEYNEAELRNDVTKPYSAMCAVLLGAMRNLHM